MDAVQQGCSFRYPLLEVEELLPLPPAQKKGSAPLVMAMPSERSVKPWPSPVASSYGSAVPWPVAASATLARTVQQLVTPTQPAETVRPTRSGVRTYSPFGG